MYLFLLVECTNGCLSNELYDRIELETVLSSTFS